MDDLISRQAAIDALHGYFDGMLEIDTWSPCDVYGLIEILPSAQPDYPEVLGWLLAYHLKSFELHGRYLPHEVISWFINDFTKNFIAEKRAEE